MEWQLMRVHVDDWHVVEDELERGWEPFAVTDNYIYLRRQLVVERGEKASERAPTE